MEMDLKDEVSAIKSKLNDIHEDMKKFRERSNQQHLASILNDCRSDFSDVILGYATGEIENGLETKMVKDCHMKEACKALFLDLLKGNLNQIKEGNVSEESINTTKSKMEKMKDKAPYEQCTNCFSEAARLFDKQIGLMRSLKVYRDNDAREDSMKYLSEEKAVIEILEPLSNKQRLQMLKALSLETKTFSALSALTGLRGGNLLFHLQKLMDSGMILQRNERGDYMITEKGYRSLRGVSELYADLGSNRIKVEPTKTIQEVNV
jgi:DNA-binding transcriptional ArsR family regulator